MVRVLVKRRAGAAIISRSSCHRRHIDPLDLPPRATPDTNIGGVDSPFRLDPPRGAQKDGSDRKHPAQPCEQGATELNLRDQRGDLSADLFKGRFHLPAVSRDGRNPRR